MKRCAKGILVGLFVCVNIAFGQTLPVKLDAGSGAVFRNSAGMRTPLGGAAVVTMGDSLILAAGSQATIELETNSRLIFKGPGALALTGDSSAAYLTFNEGMVFLDRKEPKTFAVLTFWVKNYMFVPVGTAAALRVMAGGMPAVAVIDGKVLMQSPTGESAEVPAGKFGKVDQTGRIGSGALGKKVVAALEKWSGVKADPAISAGKSSSEETIDQEFIAAADASIPAASGAPQAVSAPSNAGSEHPAQPVAKSAAATPAATPANATPPTASPAVADKKSEPSAQGSSAPAPSTGTGFELSAGAVTVGDQQWTRLAFGIDVPIWKFGIFFDLEAFIDPQGKFSNKGWDFKNEPIEAIARKIRYIRFGHETDPLFVKVGGLSDVTLGYGFIMDRFTNMLHYPDQKLLGLQFYLNDVSPLGVTLQAVGADAQELRDRDHGGVGALRMAVRPLKTTAIPILSGLAVGGTFAYDRNMYAPARNWNLSAAQNRALFDRNHLPDSLKQIYRAAGYYNDTLLSQIDQENSAKSKIADFGIYGGDLSLPLISTSLLSLDLYGQSGIRADTVRGWGIGAPGVSLKVWRLTAGVEYRHVEGRFMPGFFGPYYLDERIVRDPSIATKADLLPDDTLNGVYGRLGFDIGGVLLVNGAYQYMVGKVDSAKDQRFELTGSIGPLILRKIPKLKKAEAYLYKTRIGADVVKFDSDGNRTRDAQGKYYYDGFFDKTPYLYYGYRLGFEITQGATLICDTRFGYTRDAKGKLMPDNNFNVQTAFTF